MGRPLADNGERILTAADHARNVAHAESLATAADGDRLARTIRNEVGRTFYATGGERISGDQAFAQIMTRASAAKRGS